MVKTVGRLQAELGLKKDKFKRGLKDAEKQGSRFGRAIKRIGGILAGAFAVHKIVQWGRALKEAYQVQMEAETKLATIMRQRMGLGRDAIKSLKKQASEYQKIGVLGDEVQLTGLQQLATFVHQKESLEAMLPAMNNLLAQQKGFNATGQDAVNIANMMGRAFTGQLGALTRVGITFTEAQEKALRLGTETERAAAMAEILTDNVGNVNEELGKTDLGKVQRFKNAWGDLKELLGSKLVPILGKISEWGIEQIPKMEGKLSGLKQHVVGLVNYFIDLYNESNAVRTAWEMLKYINARVFGAIKTHLKNAIEWFRGFGMVVKDVLTGNFDLIKKHIQESGEVMAKNLEENAEEIAKKWDQAMENMTKKRHIQYIEIKPTGAGTTSGGGETKPATTAAPSKVTTGTAQISTAGLRIPTGAELAGVNQAISDTASNTAELKNEFDTLGSITVDVFQGMANSISDALSSTENVFDAFWKFFTDFIKGMIIKLVAATAAALGLAIILSALGLGGGIAAKATTATTQFGKLFEGGFKMFAGFQHGGVVPSGFPNDTYPAMLSTGEQVLTPQQSRDYRSGGAMRVEFEEIGIRNETIWIAVKEHERKRKNNY
jgi:hypothetical protein